MKVTRLTKTGVRGKDYSIPDSGTTIFLVKLLKPIKLWLCIHSGAASFSLFVFRLYWNRLFQRSEWKMETSGILRHAEKGFMFKFWFDLRDKDLHNIKNGSTQTLAFYCCFGPPSCFAYTWPWHAINFKFIRRLSVFDLESYDVVLGILAVVWILHLLQTWYRIFGAGFG